MKTNTTTSVLCAALLLVTSCATTTTTPTASKTVTPGSGITLTDFKLTGDLGGDVASFTLTATALVGDAKGGSLELLSGPVALTSLDPKQKWDMSIEQYQPVPVLFGGQQQFGQSPMQPAWTGQHRFVAKFGHSGVYPVEVHFNAAVTQSNAWSAVGFHVATSAIQPVALQGLAADTEFQFANATRPERKGTNFVSYLPVDGAVSFAWKKSRPEAEGKLFYAVDMVSQISVSPGLMRQAALLNGKIMQGEMSKLTLKLRGAGDITRIQGDGVLGWTTNAAAAGEREIVVQFNQPQKDSFAVLVQMQSPIGAFPQSLEALRLEPVGATRFAGAFRIVNEGAVRLEVTQASGLSQISPDQFPESSLFRASGSQRFAYLFSSAEFALKIQADQILPEVGVSEVLAYHLGESELSVDAQIELDIREAPLRELLLSIPKGYIVAQPVASGLSDYFTGTNADNGGAELRLVYGQPVSGRQVVQIHLDRNQSLGGTNWALPRIAVAKAKSVRGFIGVSADNGFRLTTDRIQSLTEIATAFFPGQIAGLQTAFRLSDADWSATLRVERLAQTVQADAFHLFSIGEGIAYGSSVINYVISGSPISAFRVELSDEYANVAFTGQDIRGWDRTTNGYLVQLNSPVSGAYTLLATYWRPFKPQGETLTFTGARPLDAQSESGHSIIISAYQFDVKPVTVSAGLLELEPGEVPPEYRLFFDQPVLKAYRYSARPFDLKLALSPLAQGDSLAQVVDRASLTTRISKEGQALTDVRYFVKNRGNPNFRLTLRPEMQMWSATVNGAAVVPVMASASSGTNAAAGGSMYLIPLPQHADPDAVLTIDLKLAERSADAALLKLATPVVAAPVMLAEWQLQPDSGQKLVYQRGTLAPAGGASDVSGFAEMRRLVRGGDAGAALTSFGAALLLTMLAAAVWRWASGDGAHRFGARHLFGMVIGLAAVFFAAVSLLHLGGLLEPDNNPAPVGVTFLAPVQQAGSALTAEVANIPANTRTFAFAGSLVLALVAVALWIFGWLNGQKYLAQVLGWTFLAWAALRCQNGAPAFLAVLAAFLVLHVLIPSAMQLWRVPPKPRPDLPPPTMAPPPPSVVTALLAGLLTLAGTMTGISAGSPSAATAGSQPPQSVTQQIRVENQSATATAKIHWRAEKGQTLPLLFEPAVLTYVNYPKSLDLQTSPAGSRNAQQLVALASGEFDVELHYQVQIAKRGADNGFTLPVQSGLVNRAALTLANLDMDVYSAQAVSVQRSANGSNTVATLVLSPGDAWVGWKPRSRDVKSEKSVFVADFSQLYVPSAGVVEGVHRVSIQIPQGELSELVFDVPQGATITDVSDGSTATPQPATVSQQSVNGSQQAAFINRPSIISLWRFDPDARKLRVTLNPAQSRPFTLVIRSQVATGTLPFNQLIGLISVEGAASQNGLLGIATGNDVQLDNVGADKFPAINLEDFSAAVARPLTGQFPGLTVRRAFSYSDPQATATLKASAVQPDVRVVTQDTLSLGEDRAVLATTADVTILRAGIFKLSFLMPSGYDVESISGAALSHWTELKTDAGRVITLNLNGKTEGRQQFTISLSGPGVKNAANWLAPQVVLREANKQTGTLLVVPEQGMHLNATTLEGVTAGDPQTFGVRQKGVLVFNVRETPWKLALNIEEGDPYVRVTSLQHVTINEAQMKIAANLQYQIENTGVKSFQVLIPTNAEGVTFQGDQLVDSLALDGAVTNGLQTWEIKLQRRVIGQYLLQVKYQTPIADLSGEAALRGVQAVDVRSQGGYVTLESAGRLQVRVDNLPESLQPTEWQAIPTTLQKDMPAIAASFSYRLVEADFQLPLKLERHEAAKLLPARINNITLTSVISDAGVMLTHAQLEILPGDKRLLHVTLPAGATTRFWFAFVNHNGAWPWREKDEILIPLEQQSRGGQPEPVEIFFSSEVGKAEGGALDLNLLAPKFDLPLEDLTWRVFLNDKWRLQKWTGALQLQNEEVVNGGGAFDVQSYLRAEAGYQQQKTQEARQMFALGNTALQSGDPQQARRAFSQAYDLSHNDAAFNEDARVQLNNLKLQQALVGLNVRQATVANGNNVLVSGGGGMGGALNEFKNNKDANYTQQEAKQIIDNGSAEQNRSLMNLADQLIKQQDAAVANPAVIRANIPEQGRLLTFKRAVVVEPMADLNIGLEARSGNAGWWKMRVLLMAGTVLVLAAFSLLMRALVKSKQA